MKKFVSLLLALMMALSLVACGSKADTTTDDKTDDDTVTEPANALEKIKADGVLTVALSPDFSPMEFVDSSKTGQDQYVGFDITLAKYIAENLGVELVIEPIGFDASQTAVYTGSVPMSISGYSWTEDRAQNYELSDYYYAGENETRQALLIKKENADKYTSPEDLAGQDVGAQNASLQMQLVTEQLTDADPISIGDITVGVMELKSGTIERRFVDGLSDTVCNHALEKVLYDNFSQLGVPPCTAEEHAFMEALSATYEGRDVPGGVGAENDPAFAEKVKAMQTSHFNDFLMPLYQGPAFNAGSTDVGDVSYQCPTAQIHVAVWPNHATAGRWCPAARRPWPIRPPCTPARCCAPPPSICWSSPRCWRPPRPSSGSGRRAGTPAPSRRTPCRRPSSCKERTPLTCRSGVFSYRCSSFSRRKLRLASSRPSAASTSAAAPSTQVSVSVSPRLHSQENSR